jgi:hypothetical protein
MTQKRKNTMPVRPARHCALIGVTLAVALLLGGCETTNGSGASASDVTASDASRLTRSGFLTDYARLKPMPWGNGIECWREPHLNAAQYTKILVSRIVVSIAPPKGEDVAPTVDPSDLKALTDYFHTALVKALRPQLQIVETAGPGVLVMRVALTNLVPTQVSRSIAGTLIPYGFVAEAGSGVATGRPAGSTPYLGETGMEMQFRDGGNGAVLGECRDTQIGRKYAVSEGDDVVTTWANGYLNSFQSWAYARDAFDKWSAQVAERLAQLRGVRPR